MKWACLLLSPQFGREGIVSRPDEKSVTGQTSKNRTKIVIFLWNVHLTYIQDALNSEEARRAPFTDCDLMFCNDPVALVLSNVLSPPGETERDASRCQGRTGGDKALTVRVKFHTVPHETTGTPLEKKTMLKAVILALCAAAVWLFL